MIEPGFDNLPSALKWALTFGWFIAGLAAWMFGRRFRASTPDEAVLRESAPAEREVERLQRQISTDELRRDLEKVVRSVKIAIEGQFQTLETEVRQEMKDARSDMHVTLAEYERRIRNVELDNASRGGRPRPR